MTKGFHDSYHNQCMSLTGRGQVTTLPDLVILRLGVMTEGENLQEAQSQNAALSQAVLQGLQQMGINDIKTYQYQIDKLYEFVDGTRIDRGFSVRNILEIRTEQLDMTGAIIDTAVSNGANVVDLISFEVSEPDIYYQQALNLAILNALQKAKSITVNLGISEDPVLINITENTTTPVPFQSPMARGEFAATPIEPGTKQIEALITAEFISTGQIDPMLYEYE